MPKKPALHALYRFYDRSEQLLYVGITLNPSMRWKQHRKGQPWWTDVAFITVESHADRQAVLAAEVAAIAAESPRYNIQHRPKPTAQTIRWDEGCATPGCKAAAIYAVGPELTCIYHSMDTVTRRHDLGPSADMKMTRAPTVDNPDLAAGHTGHKCPPNKDTDVPPNSKSVGHRKRKERGTSDVPPLEEINRGEQTRIGEK